jgi:hypothetical protein
MNRKAPALMAFGLACCSMAALSAPPVAAPAAPFVAKDSNGLPLPRACRLGNDCLTLDSHPFEICQVSTKSCGDKLAEVLQVDQPKAVSKPAPRLQRTSR